MITSVIKHRDVNGAEKPAPVAARKTSTTLVHITQSSKRVGATRHASAFRETPPGLKHEINIQAPRLGRNGKKFCDSVETSARAMHATFSQERN